MAENAVGAPPQGAWRGQDRKTQPGAKMLVVEDDTALADGLEFGGRAVVNIGTVRGFGYMVEEPRGATR